MKPFPLLWAFGKASGLRDFEVEQREIKARRFGAKQDVLYQNYNGYWVPWSALLNADTREEIAQIAEDQFGVDADHLLATGELRDGPKPWRPPLSQMRKRNPGG